MTPHRASPASVAAAIWGGSISKNARSASRVSLRPKPSVPSDWYDVGSQRLTRSGRPVVQSVAATIGPPSGPRTCET